MTRLLVADDAAFIREIVRHIALKNGIDLIGEAVDGAQAVEMAIQLKPDVILMDIIMPNKSGIEATKEIIQAMPEMKIIAFSTTDQEMAVLRAIEAGCCSYIVKPFKAEELVKAIRRAVDGQEVAGQIK